MTPRFLAALAVSCVLAAATGGYLAVRQNAAPAVVPLASSFSPVETLADQPTPGAEPAGEVGAPSPVAGPTAAEGDAAERGVSNPAKEKRRSGGSAAVKPSTAKKATTSRQLETVPYSAAGTDSGRAPASIAGIGSLPSQAGSQQTDTAELPSRNGPTTPSSIDPASGVPQQSSGSSPVVGEQQQAWGDGKPSAQEEFEEVTVARESVVGVQFETTVSSETASVEDAVEARVTRDVRAGGRVAIPAGSRMLGSVTVADRGGRFKERARVGVRFHTLVLPDGTRVNAPTDTIFREGSSPTNESAAKVGGAAVGGAILGAILGGGKGAAIGGSIGAAGGTAAVMAGERNAAILAAGATVTVRLQAPVTVTLDR